MTDESPSREILGRGRFLQLVREGRWEIAERVSSHGAVAIVAVTTDRRLILTEQHRPAVQRSVIDLAAGLAGDAPDFVGEALINSAKRELLEETGYTARRWQHLMDCPSSPGLTSEIVSYFLATDCRHKQAGGGDEHEQITVHTPLLRDIRRWLSRRAELGVLIDVKVYAALTLLRGR